MTFAWRKNADQPGSALVLLNSRTDYPSERVARFRLACGHLMGCYDREHQHAVRSSTMFCDVDMSWAEVMEQVA